MKRITFNCHDFGMFDAEFTGADYEFFYKHTGAFKRFLKEESTEQKKDFVEAYCEFFQNHGEMRAIAPGKDHKKRFVDSFRCYAMDNFVNGKHYVPGEGKLSASRQFLNDTVLVAKNKHMIQYMDSQFYTKDPFFNRETRDVFRRLFGEPSESGTCIKVICLLPLYLKFGGSMCRYLRRWLEVDEMVPSYPAIKGSAKVQKSNKKAKEKKVKNEEKKVKEEKKLSETETDDTPAVMVFKIDRDGVQEIRRTSTGEHKFQAVNDPAYLAKAGFPWPQIANTFEELPLREKEEVERQRRREEKFINEKMKVAEAELMHEKMEKFEEIFRQQGAMSARVYKTGMPKEYSEAKKSSEKLSKTKASAEKNTKGKKFDEVKSKDDKEKTVEKQMGEHKSSIKNISNEPMHIYCERHKPKSDVAEQKLDERELHKEISFQEKNKSDDVMMQDESYNNKERFIKDAFPGLHLGEPHPNEVYEKLIIKEKKKELIYDSRDVKLHTCAWCKYMENEPKMFKKCQKCKGKGTKFYCSRSCQRNDWGTHRDRHEN